MSTAIPTIRNTTDATPGEPLALRARKRRTELLLVLDELPDDELLLRSDITIVISSFDGLLAGDSDHLAAVTAADLSHLLENTKHLAEKTSIERRR